MRVHWFSTVMYEIGSYCHSWTLCFNWGQLSLSYGLWRRILKCQATAFYSYLHEASVYLLICRRCVHSRIICGCIHVLCGFSWTSLLCLQRFVSSEKTVKTVWFKDYFGGWSEFTWRDVWDVDGFVLNVPSLPSPGICIILVHLLIKFKLHFLPESVAVVSLGEYVLRNVPLGVQECAAARWNAYQTAVLGIPNMCLFFLQSPKSEH